MYSFLAYRIHEGFFAWKELKESKSEAFVKKVEAAWMKKYPGEEIQND